MLDLTDYSYKSKDYFKKYCNNINQKRGLNKLEESRQPDHFFFSVGYIIYKHKISFEIEELKIFTNLNDYEEWLLNPIKFDYKKFKVEWLLTINYPVYLERLKGNINIARILDSNLKEVFDSDLAKIKYEYFSIDNTI